jgi:hypothetical protein
MTLFQVEELTSYWTHHPPLHLLVAAYLGLANDRRRSKPQARATREKPSSADVVSMLAQLGPGFTGGDVHAGLSPVILDLAELRRRAGSAD